MIVLRSLDIFHSENRTISDNTTGVNFSSCPLLSYISNRSLKIRLYQTENVLYLYVNIMLTFGNLI